MLLSVSVYIHQGTRLERLDPSTKAHVCYSEILSLVSGGKEKQARTEKRLKMLDETVKAFCRMIVGAIN